MAKKPDKPWQFQVSLALVLLVVVLIGGFFYQSSLEVRAARPVEVAVERLSNPSSSGVDTPAANNTNEPKAAP